MSLVVPDSHARGLSSVADLVEQYKQMEPKFKLVFEKYDADKNGLMDRKEYMEFAKGMLVGSMRGDASEFVTRIDQAKDIFHKSMREAKVCWDNMLKDEDDCITWELFWEFWSSDRMLESVRKNGLRSVFLCFDAWGVPTFHQEFMDQKPRFEKAFSKYDVDKNGYFDAREFQVFAEATLRARPDLASRLGEIDENQDGKVTWAEFWSFFSQGDQFAINQDMLNSVEGLLRGWGC